MTHQSHIFLFVNKPPKQTKRLFDTTKPCLTFWNEICMEYIYHFQIRQTMKEIVFKSNFKCQGCIDKVRETLNNHPQIGSWSIDLESPDKTLTILSSLSNTELEMLIAQKGFKITQKQ